MVFNKASKFFPLNVQKSPRYLAMPSRNCNQSTWKVNYYREKEKLGLTEAGVQLPEDRPVQELGIEEEAVQTGSQRRPAWKLAAAIGHFT